MIRPNNTLIKSEAVANIKRAQETLLKNIYNYRKIILKSNGNSQELTKVNNFIHHLELSLELIWRSTGFEDMAENDLKDGVTEMENSGVTWISSASELVNERKRDIA